MRESVHMSCRMCCQSRTTNVKIRSVLLSASMVALSSCATEAASVDACAALEPSLAESSFVLVQSPAAGQRAMSPMRLYGCSRTFESNVVWELRGRDGRLLSSGHTMGGGVSGAAAFETDIEFDISVPEVGRLEVFEEDMSDGEGFPPTRTVLPIVLAPGSP